MMNLSSYTLLTLIILIALFTGCGGGGNGVRDAIDNDGVVNEIDYPVRSINNR